MNYWRTDPPFAKAAKDGAPKEENMEMNLETATIANITGEKYLAHRMYGTFQVAGCADGESVALTRVTPRTASMDYGDKRILPLAISAREIAEDVCREINSDAGERSYLGVFVCAGDAPTEAELRAAREKLDEFYRALVAAANREWERSHSYLFIHDLQRRAAARLGMVKEWHYEARETEECPGCGERVKPGVAVCKSCRAILNRDKAAALGIVGYADRAAGTGASASAADAAQAVAPGERVVDHSRARR
jgi:hypothetical protein